MKISKFTQTTIEDGIELLHGILCFIAHIG